MSDIKQQSQIDALMRVAHGSHDAESLRQIARQLERLSAWTEAREVERMVDALEEAENDRQEVIAWRMRK